MSSRFTRACDEEGIVRLAELLALKLRKGDVVALSGELGAGKTTLTRALIRALPGAGAAEVTSPTFALMNVYETPRLTVTHCDLYRLGGPEEEIELGLEEAAEMGVLIVEWPERSVALPADGGPGDPPRRGRGYRRGGRQRCPHRGAYRLSRYAAGMARRQHRAP